jgi:hypothetical protein
MEGPTLKAGRERHEPSKQPSCEDNRVYQGHAPQVAWLSAFSGNFHFPAEQAALTRVEGLLPPLITCFVKL